MGTGIASPEPTLAMVKALAWPCAPGDVAKVATEPLRFCAVLCAAAAPLAPPPIPPAPAVALATDATEESEPEVAVLAAWALPPAAVLAGPAIAGPPAPPVAVADDDT